LIITLDPNPCHNQKTSIITLLIQYIEPKFKGQHKKPASPPTIINEEKEYEVEEVWKHRKQDRGMQYLMH